MNIKTRIKNLIFSKFLPIDVVLKNEYVNTSYEVYMKKNESLLFVDNFYYEDDCYEYINDLKKNNPKITYVVITCQNFLKRKIKKEIKDE